MILTFFELDITIITPVFNKGEIVFFVASRGHHADIGGISPGSMPPHSKELYQEGAAIKSFKIVSKGHFDQKGLEDHLCTIPASYPGCSGSRAFRDNMSGTYTRMATLDRTLIIYINRLKSTNSCQSKRYWVSQGID